MATANGTTATDELEAAKRRAAFYAVEQHVAAGTRVGVGTGSTARYVVDALAERWRVGALSGVVCVPTSFHARQLLIAHGLPLSDVEQTAELDVCIDGADEVDAALDCIKGGGGCLTQEKIVQGCARRFVVVGDYGKRSERLGERFPRLPIEVVPAAFAPVRRRMDAAEGGECVLRMGKCIAGPVITDNGNYLLDWHFPADGGVARDWAAVHARLKQLTGVVETGLFVGVAERAYFGMRDGSVCQLVRGAASAGCDAAGCGDCRRWGGTVVVAANSNL